MLSEIDALDSVARIAAPPNSARSYANLVRTTTFLFGTEGWLATQGGTLSGAATLTKDPNSVRGSPTNARVTMPPSSFGAADWFAAAQLSIAVEGGSSYAFCADLIPVAALGNVQINWMSRAGQYLFSEFSDPVTPRAMPALPSLTDFVRSGKIVNAPIEAATADFFVVGRSIYSPGAYISFARPFLGKVPRGKFYLPDWNAGTGGPVGTGQVVENAITFSVRATREDTVYTAGGSNNSVTNLVVANLALRYPASIKATAKFRAGSSHPGWGKLIRIVNPSPYTIHASAPYRTDPASVVINSSGVIENVAPYTGQAYCQASIGLPAGNHSIGVEVRGVLAPGYQEWAESIDLSVLVTYR